MRPIGKPVEEVAVFGSKFELPMVRRGRLVPVYQQLAPSEKRELLGGVLDVLAINWSVLDDGILHREEIHSPPPNLK